MEDVLLVKRGQKNIRILTLKLIADQLDVNFNELI